MCESQGESASHFHYQIWTNFSESPHFQGSSIRMEFIHPTGHEWLWKKPLTDCGFFCSYSFLRDDGSHCTRHAVTYNAKIICLNIRRTVFQYFKKRIVSTENQNSPIAVPVSLIFLLCVFYHSLFSTFRLKSVAIPQDGYYFLAIVSGSCFFIIHCQLGLKYLLQSLKAQLHSLYLDLLLISYSQELVLRGAVCKKFHLLDLA